MGKHGEGYLYQKRGKGCWRVRWTFEGKSHDESTGTTDYEKAKKIARQKTACDSALGDVRALTARLERAKDEQTILEAKTNPSLNLFRMIEAFKSCDVVRRRKNARTTMESWDARGNYLIDRFGGTTEMRQLTREQIEEMMREYEKQVSPSQFNYALGFYKRVWRVLKKYNSPSELKARLGEHSPFEFILPMKRNEVVGKKPFTPEQLTRIWRVLDEINNAELTMLFELARYTGARLHDLVSWQWKDVKFNQLKEDGVLKREVVFEWKPIKTMNSTGKTIILPIVNQKVVDDLYFRYIHRLDDNEYITPTMLELYNRNKAKPLTNLCQSVFKRAGIVTTQKVEGNSRANCVYGMHSFRHTLVSELFQNGVDLGTIQHLYTGHGSAFVTELYAHADMNKKRVDLSALKDIDTKPKTPTKFVEELTEQDTKLFDEVMLMDASQEVKDALLLVIRLKSNEELKKVIDFTKKVVEGRSA